MVLSAGAVEVINEEDETEPLDHSTGSRKKPEGVIPWQESRSSVTQGKFAMHGDKRIE